MDIIDITRDKWNAQADKYNQWSALDMDEKLGLIAVEANERIATLEAALKDARECVVDWANYAPEFSLERHGYKDDLARIDAVLNKPEIEGE